MQIDFHRNPNEPDSYTSSHHDLLSSHEKLTTVLKQAIAFISTSNDLKLSECSNFVMSGCEMLMRSALDKNPDGCFVVHRHIEGISTLINKHSH